MKKCLIWLFSLCAIVIFFTLFTLFSGIEGTYYYCDYQFKDTLILSKNSSYERILDIKGEDAPVIIKGKWTKNSNNTLSFFPENNLSEYKTKYHNSLKDFTDIELSSNLKVSNFFGARYFETYHNGNSTFLKKIK